MSSPAARYSLVFGTAAASAAGLMLAGALTFREPEPPAFFDTGLICTASRDDVSTLIANLTPAPFMSLEAVESLIAEYNGLGPDPVLEQDPDQPHLYLVKWRDSAGLPHRVGSPAIIIFDAKRQRMTMEIWARHGVAHRDGGLPATTEWDSDSRVRVQTWRKNGLLHNAAGAADRIYDWENDLLIQSWYLNGDLFRVAGSPSHTETLISSGLIVQEVWANRVSEDRLQHRADGLHILEHDPRTGLQKRRLYRFHTGMAHSDELTYEVLSNPQTGMPAREEWTQNDRLIGFVEYNANGLPSRAYPDSARIQALRDMITSGGIHDGHDHTGHHP